jgi:O-antigen/teichoic acid export membrane protein
MGAGRGGSADSTKSTIIRRVAHDKEGARQSTTAGRPPTRRGMDDVSIDSSEAAAPPPPATLFRNSFFGLTARIFGIAGAALAAVLTIRTLSVSDYGLLATGLALTSVFAALTELGITTVTAREIVHGPEQVGSRLGTALAAQLSAAVLAAALLVPVGLLLGYPPTTLAVLGIGTLIVLAQGGLAVYNAVFLAQRVFVYVAVYTSIQYVVLLLGTGLAALVHAGPEGFALAAAGSYIAAVLVAATVVRLRLRVRPGLRETWRAAPSLLWAAIPIALSGSIATIYGRIDVVLLSKLGDASEVAIYNVPLIVVEMTQVIPAVIATAFFPLLTLQLRDVPDDAQTSYDLLIRLFLFISVPIAFVLGIAGGDILVAAFGSAYRPAGPVLSILAPTVIFSFLTYLFWYGMLAVRLERGRVPVVLVGLALNVGLNGWLIPTHGARGAAAALVVSDAFMVAWLLTVVARSVFKFRWRNLFGQPVLAGGIAALLLLLPLPAPAIAALTATVYVGLLLITGYIRSEEWEPATGPVRDILSRARRAAKPRVP